MSFAKYLFLLLLVYSPLCASPSEKVGIGEEVLYTFPLDADQRVLPAPQSVCDAISLIMRSDVEMHAALQTNAVGVAVVGTKQGIIPLSFGPFYMQSPSYMQSTSLALTPQWLSQVNLSIEKPLESLMLPSKFVFPGNQYAISPQTQNLITQEAQVDQERMEGMFSLKRRMWDGFVFLVLALLVSITLAPLYLFYRSRYPIQKSPIIPHWAEELQKITQLPVEVGGRKLQVLLCSYLAWKVGGQDLGTRSQGKTLRDFLPELARDSDENMQVWQELTERLEKVLYGNQEDLFPEVLTSSQQVIQS